MSCGSEINEAGGSVVRTDPAEMESDGSSAEDSSSGASESGTSSQTPPSSPDSRSELQHNHLHHAPGHQEARRAHIRCLQQQRFRRSLTSVACQTDYTDEWTPMTSEEATSSSNEGTLRLMIQNFKSMSDTVRGPSKEILGVSWRIMVMPRQHVVQKKGTQKCLGFFLQCCPDAYSESWSVTAQAELRLISQKNNVPHFTRKTNHNYTAKENDWGYSCFMTWADILDENQGYIKDDRVILEVTVKAEPPKNIMSREEFRKRIDKWKDLAEMHCQRNCIDLAIEANCQALKFCKDRDSEIKASLEEQRKFFIEQKVQESIQRIEKGKDAPVKPEDETGTSQSALKQALHQSTKNMARKGIKTPKGPAKQPKMRAREPSPSPPASPPSSEVRVEEQPKTETAAVIKNIPSSREVDGKLILYGNFGAVHELVPSLNKNNFAEYTEFPAMIDMNAVKESLSWTRRNKDEENFYSELAMSVQEDLEKMTLKEGGEIECYNEQLAAYDHENQRLLFEELIERNFIDACERRQKRQKNKELGAQEAQIFEDSILAKLQGSPDETDAMDEVVKNMNVGLEFITDIDSARHRAGLLDYLDDKPFAEPSPFFFVTNSPWAGTFHPVNARINVMPPMQPFYPIMDNYPIYSDDHGSGYSSDSERQTDGCIKAKRTKREKVGCNCADHKMPRYYHQSVEMACQTDDVQAKKEAEETHDVLKTTGTNTNSTTPPGRVIKKVPKKTTKKETPAATVPTPEKLAAIRAVAASQTNTSPTAPVAAASANSATSPEPSAETDHFAQFKLKADANIDAVKVMEEWVRTWLQDAQKVKPNGVVPALNNPHEFITAYSDQVQVVSALSAVALNFMNIRRLASKINELIAVFQERTGTLRLNKLHGQIFNMAGLTFEQIPDPVTKPLPDVANADGDYVLIEQITFIEDIKEKLDEQVTGEKDLAKRLGEALRKIDEKLRANEKTIEELRDQKKKLEEQDKGHKKTDKANKQEIASLKTQVQAEKDRNSNMGKEFKEKSREVKRLETRVATISSERDELAEKSKVIHKEMSTLQKKHADEINKLRREMASLNDSKKNLQNGIAERDNENKSLQHTVEERTNQLKKFRSDYEHEKQKAAIANRELEKALDRAKKSEIDLLTRELAAGVQYLERAHSDAMKHCNEMDEAINSRARTSTEISTFMANKTEWTNIVDQIEGFIKKANADYAAHIEAVQAGKSLASLPKIAVPKPPMPPSILKVAPVAPIEPTKTTPGPIGPPRAHNAIVSTPNRANGSPVPKHSPSSPVRHPGAIGTRNGAPINGNSSVADRNSFDNNQLGGSLLSNWSWEPLESVLSHVSPSNDLLSMQGANNSSRVDQNGWDEQNNTWSNNHVSNVNQYISGPLGQTRPSNMNFNQPPGWSRPHSAQHQPVSNTMDAQQQRMMIFSQVWQPIIDRVSKKLHIDIEQAFQLTRQYVHENNVNLMTCRVSADDIADAIYQKRYHDTSRIPPGSAPGYMQNPLMGSFLDRPAIGTLGGLNSSDHLLSNLLGDSLRPSSTTDKWSNGI